MSNRHTIGVLLIAIIGFSVVSCSSFNKILGKEAKTISNTKDSKQATPYQKLFKDKKEVQTVKGLFTLHRIDDKIYFELPDSIIGRQMLMGATIEKISDSQESYIGAQPTPPIQVVFQKKDSLVLLYKMEQKSMAGNKDMEIKNALGKSSMGAIIMPFPVKALSPDSNYVFEATSLFIDDSNYANPLAPNAYNNLGGLVLRKPKFKKDLSTILSATAFNDNISVSTSSTYTVTLSFLGLINIIEDKPLTAHINHSFLLLPDEIMPVRHADSRIGTYSSVFTEYSSDEQKVKDCYYANRWRLEPKDVAAFEKGELSPPVKPILFYIDNKLPSKWIGYIKESINQWNKAFEKIGFKDAVQAKVYPENDSTFDAANLKYSCIHYNTSLSKEVHDNIWTDPRSGEIISANIYISHNIPSQIQLSRFLQTAASDESIRTLILSEKTTQEAISSLLMRNIGHCLGFSDNLAASSAFPVDSLRSPSFTSQYGISASVMDDLPFNYIATAKDYAKGVKLTQQHLGEYDTFAVKWLYSPISQAKNEADRSTTLRQWLSDKNTDPIYRYGKRQNWRASYDPRTMSADLGDNHLKATEYAFVNLAAVVRNANQWLKGQDYDYSYRSELYNHIVKQVNTYIGHVMQNIGGIYLNEKYAKDSIPSYETVPREEQRQSMKWILSQLDGMVWMDNQELILNIEPIGSPANYSQKSFGKQIFSQIEKMWLSESKSNEPYSQTEAMQDVADHIWKNTKEGKIPSTFSIFMQQAYVESLIKWCEIDDSKGRETRTSDITKKSLDNNTIQQILLDYDNPINRNQLVLDHLTDFSNEGMEPLTKIGYEVKIEQRNMWYGMMLDTQTLLKQAIKTKQPESLKFHYLYLLQKIGKILG